MAAGLAAGAVIWLQPAGAAVAGGTGSSIATMDSDGDFLPDAVEWVLLTNANAADTDGDEVTDFVEVLDGSSPRLESPALPPDHAVRLVVTGPQPGSADQRAWVHVFYRIMDPQLGTAAIQSFDTWLQRPEWPGLQIPLNSFLGGESVYRETTVPGQGLWLQVSFPLAPIAMLSAVAPCTIGIDTTVAGQSLTSGSTLAPVTEGLAALVPWSPGRFVLQSISPVPLASTVSESNRVCVMDLEEQSVGPAGTTYLVTFADCVDANELECASDCPDSVGWSITIPGGSGTVGGQ